MKCAILLLTVICWISYGYAAPGDADPDAAIIAGKQTLPGLSFQLAAPKKEYVQGEPIVVTMRYTYTGDRKLSVLVGKFDRSGRVPDYSFTAVDTEGKAVRDPVTKLGGMGGGQRWEAKLSPQEPYEQEATVNEWLAFDQPGRYTIQGHSTIVRLGDNAFGKPAIPLQSEPLELEIIPATGAVVQTDRQVLIDRMAAEYPTADKNRREAIMRELRFMMDEKAIPLLALDLEDEWPNGANQAKTGLMAFTNLAPVKAALLRLVDDENHFIPLRRIHDYFEILTAADRQIGGPGPEGPVTAQDSLALQWSRYLTPRFNKKLDRLPPERLAVAALSGLKWHALEHKDSKNWERLLANVELLPARGPIDALTQQDAAQLLLDARRNNPYDAGLRPSLRKVAENDRLFGPLRLAAIVVLHDLGDDSYRDLVADDLMQAQPRLLWNDARYGFQRAPVQAVLGDYRAPEISQRLLQLLRDVAQGKGGSAANTMNRVRDFARAASVGELTATVQMAVDTWHTPGQPLIEALAAKDSDAALPFIRLLPSDPKNELSYIRRDVISRLVTRMNTPAALAFIRELFKSDSESDRIYVAHGLAMSIQQTREPDSGNYGSLPPQPELARSFFPELLHLFQNDPSPRVRESAYYALGYITGAPKSPSIGPNSANDKQYLAQWEEWWRNNHERYGR